MKVCGRGGLSLICGCFRDLRQVVVGCQLERLEFGLVGTIKGVGYVRLGFEGVAHGLFWFSSSESANG